jgi:hypothetical protein
MPVKIPDYDDVVVFRVAQLFLDPEGEGGTAKAIADRVNQEFPQHEALSRETVYPVMAEAARRGDVRVGGRRRCGGVV